MSFSINSSFAEIAKAFVLHTSRHIFLTGRAGTGKTTFLKSIKDHTAKNMVIVAPTGVAAINAGGVTMHSFFQLPLGAFLPVRQTGFSSSPSSGTDLHTLLKNIRFNKEKRRMLEELELLVIDEVSMLRADMLDAIDGILRYYRKSGEPFGGVQVLYIGDMMQLPPVVKDDEWEYLSQYYKSLFFFDAHVLKEVEPLQIELDKIYRQSDEEFISLLNKIRDNTATEDDLRLLNRKFDPSFFPEPEEGYIVLTTHNRKADQINQSALARLDSEAHRFEGTLSGDFNESALPVEKMLTLKVGAQIMFIKNDKGEQRRYYNGKIGMVTRISNGGIWIRFPGEREELQLEQETWKNVRYQYDEGADKITEQELGSYRQYPVRLAWAVTIHKSQGLTFERAIIDAGQSFAAGQVYVALSRLTALSGLVLASQITTAAIHTESRVSAFISRKPSLSQLLETLAAEEQSFLESRLMKSFDWKQMAVLFRDHHDGYNHIRLPHQKEAVAWSSAMLTAVLALHEVAERFSNQLTRLITERADARTIHERVHAAAIYFDKEIDLKLLQPWQQHFDETKIKAKTKKYLKSLQPLYTQIIRKRQLIEQASMLAEGVARGKNINHLLEQYQAVHKHIPALPGLPTALPAREDTRSISLRMFLDGCSVAEIARKRGLATGTIEGHLLQYIETGEVSLNQLVAPEKLPVITEAINKASQRNAAAIREITGNAISYNEIRAVLLDMDRKKG